MNAQLIKILQKYFATKPISKAWVFGSYARNEQTPDSDLDILVTYEEGYRPGLFGICAIINELETLVGKKVDLVEEGRLYPLIEKEVAPQKIMIYERKSS